MLSKMRTRGNRATIKLKNACSTLATRVNSGHRSRKEQRVRKCVLDLLQLYDPDKVEDVDKLMGEWKNREMQLLQHLHQEYHLTDVGLTYFKSKYSRLFELPSIYKGTFCRQCIRRSNGEERLYHRLYKKRVTPYIIKQIKHSINILRKLNNSPHVITLHDIFESRTRLVLITDLFDYSKVSLPTVLLNNSNLNSNDAINESVIADLFNQMLQIVSYIHSKQYVHCNLNIDSFIIDEGDNDNWLLKLIRVDSCVSMADAKYKSMAMATATDCNNIYVAPEIATSRNISYKSDMWSLGILLYVMLTGMLPKQIPMIKCSNQSSQQIVEFHYKLKLDHNKFAWNHLSFHARDLITKLITKDVDKRLDINECLKHPWIGRYNNGYLKYNNLWNGYQSNLKKYQCIQKIRNGIKKLLLIKDCLGLMDDYILINDVRAIVNNWSTTFEDAQSVFIYHSIVPAHIKQLIVDFA